jgi:hypothetical protein
VLVADFVLRSPKYLDGRIEKEVCDHIIEQSATALLIQLKTQDPVSPRSPAKELKWISKAVDAADRQTAGSVRVLSQAEVHADHARRGRVTIAPGQLSPKHALALVELRGQATITIPRLPRHRDGIPRHFMTPGDFVAIVRELQTVPDLFDYLDARSKLPERVASTLGHEQVLLDWYLATGSSFEGLGSIEEAVARSAKLRSGSQAVHLRVKHLEDEEARRFADLLDRVHWSDPTRSGVLGPDGDLQRGLLRDEYLTIAYELNALRRAERREIVRMYRSKLLEADRKKGIRFFSMQSPRRGTAFLFAAAPERSEETQAKLRDLTLAAAFHAQRTFPEVRRGVGVLSPSMERSDKGCDFCFVELAGPASEEQLEAAARFFGPGRGMKISDFPTLGMSPGTTRIFGTSDDDEIRAAARSFRVGRNDPCPCGLPRKFKKCHGR